MPRTRTRRRSFGRIVEIWVGVFREHNLLTYASAIAFQALVALVALLLLLVAILGEMGRSDVWTRQVGPQVHAHVLLQVFAGLDATFEKIFHTSSGGLIAFAAVVTIWEISGLVRACMGALAQLYEYDEERPWWIRFPLSLGISVAFTASLVGAILLATAARTAVHGIWSTPFTALRWIVAVVLIGLAFGVLVRFAPAQPRTTRWESAGATLVVAGWIVQTVVFAEYLRYLANFRSAAGSLLGFYFLTSYLYVGAIVLLVGMELDELLRKDVQGTDRGILTLVRGVL